MSMMFRRRSREVPGLNTSSLPDLIFSVLFFFMIVTHMRHVTVKVKYQVPQGKELTRLTKKSAVSYIYIGRSTSAMGKVVGEESRIQLNDKYVNPIQLVDYMKAEKKRMSPEDAQQMTVSIKADKDTIMSKQVLDSLDRQILKLISQDARIPFLEVARACNVSGAAIHQRVAKLTNLGIIKGSQFIIDPEKIGYETCAYVGLYLKAPENFDQVVEALKKIPEVVECHYTTGGMDMFIKIYASNNHHLLEIIHDKLLNMDRIVYYDLSFLGIIPIGYHLISIRSK